MGEISDCHLHVRRFLPLAGLLGAAFEPVTLRAEEHGPVTADFVTELQYENAVGPDGAKPFSDYLFTTIEAGVAVAFTENLSLESVSLIEIADDPPAGENSVFEDHALFVEELKLAYHGDTWSLFGGKFNSAFGTAWDLGPGIWGVDFPEDYEVAEKIGFGGTVTYGNDTTGLHTVHASLYQADRSFLSNSLLYERGRVRLGDGGATNTDGLESFTLSLTGEDIAAVNGFGYHLAYRSHAHGDADFNAVREDAFAGAVFGVVETGSVEWDLLAEGVYISNAEGFEDGVSYLTVGGTAYYGESWNTALSLTLRTTYVPGDANINDHRFQLTTGYGFDSGLSLDVGYRYSREDGTKDHVLGFLLAYEFSL